MPPRYRHLVPERIDVDVRSSDLARRQKIPSRSDGRAGDCQRAQPPTRTLNALPKLTELVDGRRAGIIEDPPLILCARASRVRRRPPEGRGGVCRPTMATGSPTCCYEERYRVVANAARKVVGVGSVGHHAATWCCSWTGRQRRAAVPPGEGGRAVRVGPVRRASREYDHHGQRVVSGQRLMQAATDIFLGWATGPYGHDYYVRQFRDMKGSVNVRSHESRTTSSGSPRRSAG